MNTQKGFAPILLILVGLVVVGGGVYFYTEKSSKDTVKSEVVTENSLPLVKEKVEDEKNNIPSIKVVSPNGGEMYTKGTSVDIKWNATNIGSKTLEIDLYKSDGSHVYNLSSQVSSSLGVGKNAAYSWSIPTDGSPGGRTIESGQYKIRVCLSGESGICDMSDKYFTVNEIAKSPEITYLSSIKSTPESANGQIISGKLVYVVGKNLGGCTSVNNCELLVHIGDKTVSVNPAPYPEQTALTFNSPSIEDGNYDLYIENLATGLKSNIVKIRVGLILNNQ